MLQRIEPERLAHAASAYLLGLAVREELKELLNSGVSTQEEFDTKKQLLGL